MLIEYTASPEYAKFNFIFPVIISFLPESTSKPKIFFFIEISSSFTRAIFSLFSRSLACEPSNLKSKISCTKALYFNLLVSFGASR